MTTEATHPLTIYVAFGGYDVAVCTTAPEVFDAFTRRFRAMLSPSPTDHTVGRLEVHRQSEAYDIIDLREAQVEDGSLDDIVRCLVYEVECHLMRARRDLLWLHAAAAAWQGRAVVIAGVGGQGKSALVTGLCDQGWTYLAEDLLPLNRQTGQVLPFAQTPSVREQRGQELPSERLRELRKTVVDLDLSRVAQHPLPIAALILPTFTQQTPPGLTPCSPATAAVEILQHCLNFKDHGEGAVRAVCELMLHVPTFRLAYRQRDDAVTWITQCHLCLSGS
ncbi:MAG: hypothetical protein OEU26_19785 [Candidatus Tectomicrobia bacterium]|nr:hypothetical protein [Candidatus Tectomicrobia bacterium]